MSKREGYKECLTRLFNDFSARASVNEANDYLAKGWEYVAKLSNNKVVIKMSQSSIT